MRIRLPMRRLALFLPLLGLALILFLPLRLALGAIDGLTARDVSGSVWSGRLQEARLGPVALGNLDARLAVLPLLTGRARIDVERDSAAPDRFAGAFSVGGNRRAAEAVTGLLPVDGLFGALPVASIELTDVTVRFRDGACERGEGQVRAALSGAPAGLPASLSGAARCDSGALLVPLVGGAAGDGVMLRIFGDGRWSTELRVREGSGGTIEGRF